MGFNKDYLPSSPRTGHCIHEILHYFTQNKNHHISLYNIFICLICTSLRTPRTVGDLFGFFLYLGEIMNKGGSSPNVAQAIETASQDMPQTPDTNAITDALKTLAGKKHTGASHTDNHSSDADLRSLYDSNCTTGKTCGQYLFPLSLFIYSIISPFFAMSYLSRIVYLTDVLKDGLEELLEDFNNLKCDHCDKQNQCSAGCHGNPGKCHCLTIVQCHNVLPLFFKYGFVFYSARSLNGKGEDKGKSKPEWLRQCEAFSKELQKVINNEFTKLIDEINNFLTCIRQPFLLYLLTFWLVAILYFTYGLTIPLDLLHIRSHWRRALSHQISVLALLSKKAMSPTKVGYFTP
ncbi:uncharacterized protein BXIN_2831 [Babesia sp. Xinjiang]|uniref:uncharacterized protein n=1 Tax=Babesia sp. Xinjiang TaxID=462227 RepID=UPI000A2342A5|nr:uncharacterized protein BXIN_2831 [Babesia sp. Xinjiang]ORM39378.1 hypothetical protein BXIN_2831 [Babesia sp. Xinjiang]